jgi:hypothetical protein
MIFSRPCRDWIVLVEPTQHCVLGYTQPSLRDWVCKWGSHAGSLGPEVRFEKFADAIQSLLRRKNEKTYLREPQGLKPAIVL